MTDKNVWFMTGARRGMGGHIATAGAATGTAVGATGRRRGHAFIGMAKGNDDHAQA